jgi:hypothetical protein
MPDSSFWFISVMYSLVTYVHGHQGSHLVAIQSGNAELNPVLTFILVVYNWLAPVSWVFIFWYAFKTVWWYAVGVLVIGFIFRLIWTKLEVVSGLVKNAWVISLVGIPTIPLLLVCMVELVFASTETEYWLEACRRCPN